MEVSNFGAPIPGQSLFSAPGERPWERPSELNTVDEALSFYFNSMRDPEIIDDLMTVVDMGIPLAPIVKTMYMSSVMRGLHNLDVGLIVAPVLTEFLAAVAKSYDIDFKYSGVDPMEEKSAKEEQKVQMMLRVAIDKGIEAGGEEDKGVALLKEMASSLDEQVGVEAKEEDVVMPPEPAELQMVQEQGLMSRKGM